MLKAGANIAEMNIVRKHLSQIKGGSLAAAAYPAKTVSIGISDVPHDDMSVIASGPTVADNSSCADALIVSNHGGRQLDGADSSVALLPEIAEAVGKDIEVWMDGGIRSGQDVLKAYALGAKNTLVGRAFLYGLGAGGRDGVDKALAILHKELDMTMALCGHRNITDVSRDILRHSPF